MNQLMCNVCLYGSRSTLKVSCVNPGYNLCAFHSYPFSVLVSLSNKYPKMQTYKLLHLYYLLTDFKKGGGSQFDWFFFFVCIYVTWYLRQLWTDFDYFFLHWVQYSFRLDPFFLLVMSLFCYVFSGITSLFMNRF